MADNNYPLPGFHFSVDLGGVIMNCSEVSGLNMEVEEISYRDGAEQTFGQQKMSGLRKGDDVVIKKGIFADDKDYYEWFNEVAMNTPVRKDVTISLLDEEHTPVMTWKLINAWPKKISGPTLNSTGNDVAVEEMTIVHEGITVE